MLEFLIELKDFFLLNLNDYSNININFPIIIFLFAFAISLSIVFFIINARAMRSVNLVKQLLRHEAHDEKSAKTLRELKIKEDFLMRNMLSQKTGRLASIVCRVGDTRMTYEEYMKLVKGKNYKEERIDFSTARFFVSKEREELAKRMIDRDNSSILKPILISIFVFAVVACLALITPDLLSYINRSIGK